MAKRIWILLFVSFIVYSGFVYSECDPKESNLTETMKPDNRIRKGWLLWQGNNCQSCHQIYGLGGYMGPDLTNVASQKGPAYMQAFIKNGTGRMPDFHLQDQEITDLIAFLSWVDKSGHSSVKAEAVHWSGTYINQK